MLQRSHSNGGSPENDLSLADLAMPIEEEELQEAVMVGPPLPPEMIPNGPKVPNFQGKTKRQVMEESSALGVRVQIQAPVWHAVRSLRLKPLSR